MDDYQLLLHSAQWSPDRSESADPELCLTSTNECDRILRVAARHGLAPLLCRYLLNNLPNDTPPEVLSLLRHKVLEHSLFNRVHAEKLIELLQVFERAHIPVMPLKGPVLAAQLYGDISLRQFEDLDILIHRHDLERADAVMRSMGYRDRYEVIGRGEGNILRHEWRHDNYVSEDGKVHVEVHHEVGYRHVSGGFTSDIFWQEATSATVEGRIVPIPSNENLLIYLCIHGAIHMWNRIGWIADVDRFVRGNPNMDWEGVMNRSKELGCAKIVSLGLLLARDLLDSPLPEAVIPHTKTSKGTMRLKSAVVRYFFSDSHQYVEKIRRRLFYLRIIDRPRDRANYLGYLLESDQTNRPITHLPFFRFFVHFSIRCGQLLIQSAISVVKSLR